MRRAVMLAFSLAAIAVIGGCVDQRPSGVRALEKQLQEIARGPALWPGYDPLSVPLAVYDGTYTYLLRHPSPPSEFTRLGSVYRLAGRHPMVTANSSTWIGDVATATVLLDGTAGRLGPRDLAALVVHEGFHAFQGTTGRKWGSGETWLFLYPTDDATLLSLSRLETEALRRAFAAKSDADVLGWARQALELRRQRFAGMDQGSVAYERGIEVAEGTATYVEYRAAGRTKPDFPPDGFPAEAVRGRAYVTGVAWALLLDRFRPDWRADFARDDNRYLDTDLEAAIRGIEGQAACGFTAQEQEAVAAAARREVDELRADRAALQERLTAEPGWRLVIEADPDTPLWPQGFDPMNLRRLDGMLLHTRFLKLGNDASRFEVWDDSVLTEGVGPHPLFNGVKRVTLAGLAAEPQITAAADSVAIVLPTAKGSFRGATVERARQEVKVRLGRSR